MESNAAIVGLAAAAAKSGDSGLVTGLVAQLWPHINLAVCRVVKESVEPSFADLPSPLKTLRFTKLDLGNVPIHIDNIVIHDKEKDALQFDMDMGWDGDCNVQLKADYLGSFGVQKIKFHGRLSIILSPLLDTLPVVSAAQVCFINPPKFELDFLGLANLGDFSLVDEIRGIISDTLDGMLVLPNRMYFKIDPVNSFLDTYKPPIGVARVTVGNGSGFLGKRGFMSDAHDVYCNVRLGSKKWTTSTKNNTADPEWDETVDVVLFDYDQIVRVHAWDEDTANVDDDLGSAQVTVREILMAPGKKATVDLYGGIHKGGKVTLQCQVCGLSLSNLGSLETNKDENILSGLVTVLVVGAQNIPLANKKDAKTFVKVTYGSIAEFVTGTVVDAPGVDALNPVYDCAFQVPLKPTSGKESVALQVISGEDDIIGSTKVTFDEMLEAGTITEQRVIGEEGFSLEFRVSLCGVVQLNEGMTTAVAANVSRVQATTSSVSSSNAMGTVRLTVLKGWGFEVETRRRLIKRKDIPDIYCNITFGSSPKVWKTETIRNSTTPEWNDSADYLVSDHGQVITIGVFDEDKRRDTDDELGGARIKVGKLLLAGDAVDVELYDAGKPTGQFVSLRCDMLTS